MPMASDVGSERKRIGEGRNAEASTAKEAEDKQIVGRGVRRVDWRVGRSWTQYSDCRTSTKSLQYIYMSGTGSGTSSEIRKTIRDNGKYGESVIVELNPYDA